MKRNPHFHIHPTQLNKPDRKQHVKRSIIAYNEGIIENNPSGAEAKFRRLQISPFVFMRGTADLMYRDFYGTDADKAMVLCMGDVHLENYGVMETENGDLIWGLNDFDEAAFAPFTWDVKRGAVSVILAARENSFDTKERYKLAKAFVKSYINQLEEGFFIHKDEYLNTPIIKDLLDSVRKVNALKWLEEKYLDPSSPAPQFKITNEVTPIPRAIFKQRKAIIQKAIDNYLASLEYLNNKQPDEIKVLDIATKTGSGTASIGLWRYYVLAKVKHQKQQEIIILELKQERQSVLAPYAGENPLLFGSEGARVAFAENIHLPNANPYYGYTDIGKTHYLVRKRSPFKSRVNIIELDGYGDFKDYVQACGCALADAHLRANHALYGKKNAARRILDSIEINGFDKSIAHFAVKMAKQVRRDWKKARF